MKQFFKILLYFLIISICIGQRPYYEGEWKKNRYHGNGELLDKFGNKYVGEFFEGIKHGKGVLRYSNGARFEGQFVDGKKSEGTYYYSNGTKYIGKWKRGKKHGNGIFVNRNGVKENQTWANGKVQIDNEKEIIRDNLLTGNKELNKPNSESLLKDSKIDENELEGTSPLLLSAFYKSLDCIDYTLIDTTINLFMDTLKNDPSHARSYYGLSKLFFRTGDLKKANEYAVEAVQLQEEFRSWWDQLYMVSEYINKGNKNLQQDLFDEAIEDYNKITTVDSCFPGFEFYKGMTRFRQKNIEGAATYFSNALKIYPNYEKAQKGLNNVLKQLFNEGNKLYKSGDIPSAVSNYQKVIGYDPQFYIAHFQLGVTQKKQGQTQLALESFQKVLDIKPDHDKTWFTLGSLYDSEGTTEKAVEHYKKALEINSSYSKASGNLAKILTDEENYEEAENILKTALELDTEYANGYMRLGIVYIEQEKYSDAISSLEKSVNLDKDDFNKFYLLSRSYNNVQKWDEALNAANSCTNLNEKFGGGWAELGIAEFGKGNNDLALEYFEKAKQDPDWEKFVERKIDEIINPQKYQNS